MISRILESECLKTTKSWPFLALLGPRQTGKTTLCKKLFPQKTYVNLEDIQIRNFAQSDPKGFLAQFKDGAVLDEIQKVPELFSYLQVHADASGKNGEFVLTGSQNFLVMQNISQSLAGRVRILTLLPFSLSELKSAGIDCDVWNWVFSGGYPRIHDHKIHPTEWLSDYVRTYLEKDVREIKNIGNLNQFTKFLKLCAANAGQLLNLSNLGNDCGISHTTAKEWLSVLEASYVCKTLQPHHNNYNKRIKKAPKLYFHDSGLLCYLLGITQPEMLPTHPQRGAIFENAIIAEAFRTKENLAKTWSFSFWQDRIGKEIDLLIETGSNLPHVYEIKSGQTFVEDQIANLSIWQKLTHSDDQIMSLVYAGTDSFNFKNKNIISWRDFDQKLSML